MMELLAGVSTGLLVGMAAAWWVWGREPALALSQAGLPLNPGWPAALPPPRVGRQVWVAPDVGSRAALSAALARRLATSGPVLLVGAASVTAAGVYRPSGDASDAAALRDAADALVGDALILVDGPSPALAGLLVSDKPVLAVLAASDPRPEGAAVTMVDGPMALERS